MSPRNVIYENSEADPNISILKEKSDFKTVCFKKNQKTERRNLKRKLQNMANRKMTRTKLEIIC